MFQCHSPKSSQPLPLSLPQSPKDCSIHLCFFCCLTYRVIITIFLNSIYMHSVQSLSHVRLFVTPWTAARQASLPITNSKNLFKLMSIESVMPSNISSSVSPFSSCLQSLPASGSFQMSQLFASGGQSIGFQVQISPSNEHLGLVSFRMDWLDVLAIQGTLKIFL